MKNLSKNKVLFEFKAISKYLEKCLSKHDINLELELRKKDKYSRDVLLLLGYDSFFDLSVKLSYNDTSRFRISVEGFSNNLFEKSISGVVSIESLYPHIDSVVDSCISFVKMRKETLALQRRNVTATTSSEYLRHKNFNLIFDEQA